VDRLLSVHLRRLKISVIDSAKEMIGKIVPRIGRDRISLIAISDMLDNRDACHDEHQKTEDRDREENLHALQQNTKAQIFMHPFPNPIPEHLDEDAGNSAYALAVQTWYTNCVLADFHLTRVLR
jgi:hypothetical protein